MSKGSERIAKLRTFMSMLSSDSKETHPMLQGKMESCKRSIKKWIKHLDNDELPAYLVDPDKYIREEARRVYEYRKQHGQRIQDDSSER